MRTPKGRYSESRLRGSQKELTKGAELRGLDPEFFHAFLYCALRLAERGPVEIPGPGFEWRVNGTYQDLLELAVTVDPWGDRYDRWHQEFFQSNGEHSFSFVLMNHLYEIFSGEPIEAALTRLLPEVPKKAAARYGILAQEGEYVPTLEELEEMDGEYIPADINEEEWKEFERSWEKQRREEQAAWERSFPEKEFFCQTYLSCRKRYFEIENCRGLAATVERALDNYLCRAGVSGYLRDEDFFAAYGLLDRSEKELRALLGEVQ